LFITINGFILKAEALSDIKDNEVGLSSFLRDTMKISKLDEFEVKVAVVNEPNPLNSVDIMIECLFYEAERIKVDNTGAISVHENDITEALRAKTQDKYVNRGEWIPLELKDGDIIVKV